MSRHVTSRHVMSHHVTSCHVSLLVTHVLYMYICTTNLPLGNEQQSVKAVEELRGGLVDAGDDGLPFLVSQLLQSSEEGEGSSAVQP